MSREFERVQRFSHDVAEIPNSVKNFRFIVYDFKRRILNHLDEKLKKDTDDSIQDLGNLDAVSGKIKHLGNILKLILRSEDPMNEFDDRPEFKSVIRLFQSADLLRSSHFKCPECNAPNTVNSHLKCTNCGIQLELFNFQALDPESRNLCEYYVDTDIHLLPFDLSPDHAKSVLSK